MKERGRVVKQDTQNGNSSLLLANLRKINHHLLVKRTNPGTMPPTGSQLEVGYTQFPHSHQFQVFVA